MPFFLASLVFVSFAVFEWWRTPELSLESLESVDDRWTLRSDTVLFINTLTWIGLYGCILYTFSYSLFIKVVN